MNILFYDQFRLQYGGGGEVWLAHVAQNLARLGMNVQVATTSKTVPEAEGASLSDLLSDPPLFGVTRLESVTMPLGLPFILPGQLPIFLRLLQDADVVYYIHGSPFFEIPLLLLAKKALRKRVIAVYEGPLRPQKALLRLIRLLTARLLILLGIPDGHHVLNRADATLLRRLGGRNVRIIPNGTDLTGPRRSPGVHSPSGFNVLFVGRLGHQKGFDLFLALVPLLEAEIGKDRVIFTVIGRGPMEPELKQAAREHGNLIHVPYVPHKNMADYYADAHLFVAPYRYEGQPLTVVEAQAAGLPVVATNLAGIEETLRDNETGALVPPEDIEDFSKAVLHYYDLWQRNPALYDAISEKARKQAKQFSWSIVSEQILEFIRDTMSSEKA